ncbi:MAG: hypothetical protein AB1442_13700 [Nitrospirota bacterium]
MKFTVEIPDDFVPKDPVGVVYALRDALEFAEIPTVIEELIERAGIHQILDCSTIHVRPADMDLLGEVPGQGRSTEILAYPNEYGAFVYVPAPPEITEDFKGREEYLAILRADCFSESFVKVLEFAADKNCIWIKFDGDGCIWKELDKREEDWR